ncbi:MAG: YfcE family phosphodiesterase [Patescibacteria group bacterium]|nr:YfcE family phosphodiesterase [Patescibacteria group bacterium]
MLIAIAADLHDNLANWHKFKEYSKKQGINTLLFCGDLCNSQTLKKINSEWPGKIFLIAGNQELYDQDKVNKLSNINFLGRYGKVKINNLNIGLIHEPEYKERTIGENQELNYLFYGHTHKPWLSRDRGVIIANPGTLGGVFYKASFAVLDTDTGKLELKILENI